MGYSNSIPIDDATQQAVLKAEFEALKTLTYIAGVNYWVGAGSKTAGGYTNLLVLSNGRWKLRPAAYDLASFYQLETFENNQQRSIQRFSVRDVIATKSPL
jgi:hypothetical protein